MNRVAKLKEAKWGLEAGDGRPAVYGGAFKGRFGSRENVRSSPPSAIHLAF
jgi:hypothetical protein